MSDLIVDTEAHAGNSLHIILITFGEGFLKRISQIFTDNKTKKQMNYFQTK